METIDVDRIRRSFPAKFSREIIDAIVAELGARLIRDRLILDPYAGIGGGAVIGELSGNDWVGSEIEPEFAACHPDVVCGNSRDLPIHMAFYAGQIDVVITSPDYGNRFADQYLGSSNEKCRRCDGTGDGPCSACDGTGKAPSKRAGYAVSLGRKTTPGAGTRHTFGTNYRNIHLGVLNSTIEFANPGALLIYNVSSVIAAKRYVPVMEWWLSSIAARAEILALKAVETRRHGFGANHDARVDVEHLIIARCPQ